MNRHSGLQGPITAIEICSLVLKYLYGRAGELLPWVEVCSVCMLMPFNPSLPLQL